MSFEESCPSRTQLLKIKNGNESFFQLFKLKDTVVIDSRIVFLDKFKLVHSLHDILLLLEFGFRDISIDFLQEDEFEVICRKSLSISYEVEMVQGTYESYSKFLKLSINAILYVAKSHVKLNMIQLIEVEDLERVEIKPFLC